MNIVLNLVEVPLSCLLNENVSGNHVVRILDLASVMCNYIFLSISRQYWRSLAIPHQCMLLGLSYLPTYSKIRRCFTYPCAH
jgi:hypothetical protein